MLLFLCNLCVKYRQKTLKCDKIHLRIDDKIGGIMDVNKLNDSDLIELYQNVTNFIKYLENARKQN